MTKYEALSILKLPQDATWEQIDDAYDHMREFYYPKYYGSPNEFTPNQIQEELYAELSHDYYKEPKGVQYRNMIPDAYHYALYNYARVCQAYAYLIDLKNKDMTVDPNTPYGYDVLHYGKTVAELREKIPAIRCLVNKWNVIGYLVCGFIGLMFNGETNFFSIAAEVLKWIYVVLFVGQWITMPLDMLLLIPKMIWDGMRHGAGMGIWLTKPITIAFFGALYGLGGVFCMFLLPHKAVDDRDIRYDPPIKNAKKGRAMAKELYEKAMANTEYFHYVDPPFIDDSIPVIRKALEELADMYKMARTNLSSTQFYYDDTVERAGKLVDWNLDGDVEWDSDNYSRALDKRSREVGKAEYELRVIERKIIPFFQQVYANPADYIETK